MADCTEIVCPGFTPVRMSSWEPLPLDQLPVFRFGRRQKMGFSGNLIISSSGFKVEVGAGRIPHSVLASFLLLF